MARVLAISSFVASGHVGLGAAVPALNRLGHEVVALPTVLLSNHKAHLHAAGEPVETVRLSAMLDALDGNGVLSEIDAVLTGYLPTVEHVRFAVDAAARVAARSPAAELCCDPILGDDPKGLYMPMAVAEALRDELAPLADILFPNRFELAWLSQSNVEDAASAVEAMQQLGNRWVLATSIPAEPGWIANVLHGAGEAFQCRVARRAAVPHGTGDLLAALFLGHRLRGGRAADHFGLAVAGVEAALGIGAGTAPAVNAERAMPELRLIGTEDVWSNPQSPHVERL